MIRNLVVALSMLLPLVHVAGAQETRPARPKRHPVPGKKAQADALKLLKTIFKTEYAKTRSEDVAKRARVLLKHAGETADDPAAQYVMYVEAQKAALRAGDVQTAIAAADALGSQFQVDALAGKTSLLISAVRTAATLNARKLLVAECVKHVDLLMAADQYDVGAKLLARAEYLAVRIRHQPTTTQVREQKRRLLYMRTEFAKLAGVAKALDDNPDDPKANLKMGRFACFVKGDWTAGLPRLLKGSDAALKELAGLSLSDPGDSAGRNKLAHAWWALAEKMPAPVRVHVRAHAAKWYGLALPELKGLARLIAKKRIKEAGTSGKQPGGVIDMLAIIDISKDAHPSDKWAMDKGTLQCVQGHGVPKVVLPYEPPEEYDVRFSFMQPKLRNAVGVVLAKSKGSFAWLVGNEAGLHCVFSVKGDVKDPGNPTLKTVQGLIRPNRKNTSTVKVRNDGVKGYVNGRLVVSYKTDFTDMQTTVWHRIRKTGQLAIFADDPTVFYEVKVIEITGKGKMLR